MTQTAPAPHPLAVLPLLEPRVEQHARTLDLEAAIEDRLATRTQRFRCGTALFREDLPRAGSLNVLRIDAGVEALDPSALLQFVDELQHGLPQRSIRVVDDERADQLRPAFAAAGWVVARMSLMAPRRRPDRPVDTSAVHEVALEHVRRDGEYTLGRAHRDLDSAEQLLIAGGLPVDGIETRAFAATVANEVAAYAVARVGGEVAKLTELDALVRAQGHGLGRAVIWGAVKALRDEGVRLVAVEAEDEWVRWIFLRLGFEDVGHTHRFVRPWGD
jgi:predicted N-acetyltransferase YhbS